MHKCRINVALNKENKSIITYQHSWCDNKFHLVADCTSDYNPVGIGVCDHCAAGIIFTRFREEWFVIPFVHS